MRRSPTTRLGVQQLEARDVPSVVSVVPDPLGNVHVYSNNANSNVTIQALPITNWVHVTDATNGFDQWVQNPFGLKEVVYHGGSAIDWVNGMDALVPLTLDGGAGNDALLGGPMNDNLYGRSGSDALYGGAGNDFLDDGSAAGTEPNHAEKGDMVAQWTTRMGPEDAKAYQSSDVDQRGTATCYILAPLAAAAKAGINLPGRITYLGNGDYRVKLLNENGGSSYEYVSLEGGLLAHEPLAKDAETWVVLFHRAILQRRGHDWSVKGDGDYGRAREILPYLTGRPTTTHGDVSLLGTGHLGYQDLVAVANALAAGRAVTADTHSGNYGTWHIGGSVTSTILVANHYYSIESVNFDDGMITLRNPWGADGGYQGYATPSIDGANDGLVTISFQSFYGSFDQIQIG